MKRRKSRELALTFLYQVEMKNEWNAGIEDLLKEFWEEQTVSDPDIKEFANILVLGTLKNLVFIDEKISRTAINWSIKRMPCLDKNILRIAIFELLFMDNIPVLVSINEAIELAKKYSAEDSPRFINGILHKIKEGITKDTAGSPEKS
jgi:transcription antitermination factor NusB